MSVVMGLANRRVMKFAQHDWEVSGEYEPEVEKFSMSPRRLLTTAISLFLGLALCYCSLFYLPAYFEDNRVFQASSHKDLEPSLSGEPIKAGWFTPYLDLLRVKRGYFKAGQIIEAEYVLSKENDFVISVTRCASRPIIEIFSCKPLETIEYVQSDTMRGKLRIQAPSNGFYNVTEFSRGEQPSDLKYAVLWRRG
jgi:hypothetical protein